MFYFLQFDSSACVHGVLRKLHRLTRQWSVMNIAILANSASEFHQMAEPAKKAVRRDKTKTTNSPGSPFPAQQLHLHSSGCMPSSAACNLAKGFSHHPSCKPHLSATPMSSLISTPQLTRGMPPRIKNNETTKPSGSMAAVFPTVQLASRAAAPNWRASRNVIVSLPDLSGQAPARHSAMQD